MLKLKSILATLALCSTLTLSVPAPKAEAGIFLAPTGVGILMIILGAARDDLFLLILDGQDNVSQMEEKLAAKYNFIDDQQALKDLSALIVKKVKTTQVCDTEIEVKLDRDAVLDILAPTGLIELEPARVQALLNDLT